MIPLEELLSNPRVIPAKYVVRPKVWDDMLNEDRYLWCLEVTDGGRWGWAVRRGGRERLGAMNRKGEIIFEDRHSEANRFRRYPLAEALALALKYVDQQKVNRMTAVQAIERLHERLHVHG